MIPLLDPSDPLVRDLEPMVRLAIARELRAFRDHHELDAEVLTVEQWHEFQGREEWGGHSSPPEVRAVSNKAWQKACRTRKAREATVRQTERRRVQRECMADLLDERQRINAERSAERTAEVASTPNTTLRTEPQPSDHVAPLGERGPPCVRAISTDSGLGLSVALGKVPAMTGSKIVPTGRTGGDG